MADLKSMRYIVKKYNSEQYNFNDVIGGVLTKLEDLHFLVEGKYKELFEVGHDSSTIFHEAFYNKYRSGWLVMQYVYDEFIANIIAPEFNEDFLYQKFPTFRVHLPENVAVGRFHYDAEFGHPEGEINYIIPLTDSDNTASVWIESEQFKLDFEPMKLRIGEYIRFNGNQLTHGNKINETSKTRVSMDFRILPISCYKETGAESLTTKTKFVEGQYYKKFVK